MSSPFRLVTLGSVHVEGTQWRPVKVLALLSYLSIQGPTSRRRLRELFWPDAQDPGASLRVLLGQVRRQLPGAVVGDETVELRLSSDASELLGLNSSLDDDRLGLYVGPFLAGVELTDVSPEIHEWVLDTRDRLAAAARLAAVRAAELAGSPAEAGEWARRAASIIEGPPMEPELIERLLRLALPGSLLETDLRREQAEYGNSPIPAVLHSGVETELLGREWELDGLLLSLSDPEVRLIEITGAGGIGKSTLAAALLREQADLSSVQVLSVPLETAYASSEAAARLSVALNLKVNDRGDGWLAFAQAWGERPLLVLLDGAEGLPDLGRGIGTLLAQCAGVRIVVTSRVQRLTLPGSVGQLPLSLHLAGSVHLALDGLKVPGTGEPPDRVARSAAVQLFVRGARRYLPQFVLNPENMPLVSSIVRRLEGHPLATVLSATWIRVYPLARIHTQILQDLTALRAESGSGDRHHLTAVFEHSWQLLDSDESQAIATLSVFQGFTPGTAYEVADISESRLESLKRHSLLRELHLDAQGKRRLEVPVVFAAQAQAHLTNSAIVKHAHATYYLKHLMTHAPESDDVDIERANIVAAIGHSVSQGQNVSVHIDTLLASYDRRGLLDSGIDTLYALRETLSAEHTETAGSILIGLAWLLRLSSNYRKSEDLCIYILDKFKAEDSIVRMKASNIIANSLIQRGKNFEALGYLKDALEIAKIRKDKIREIMYSLNISEIYINMGLYQNAINLANDLPHNFQDENLNLLIREQILRSRYYIDSFDETNKKAVESFMHDFIAVELSRPYMLVALTYARMLVKLRAYEKASMALRSLVKHTTEGGVWDIGIAAQILEVEIDHETGKINSGKSRIANVIRSKSLLDDPRAIYEMILVCSENIFDIDSKFATSALLTIINSDSSTHFQIQLAKIKLKKDSIRNKHVLLSSSDIIEWMLMFYL